MALCHRAGAFIAKFAYPSQSITFPVQYVGDWHLKTHGARNGGLLLELKQNVHL